MDPKPPPKRYQMPPSDAGASTAREVPARYRAWPRVDDHVVTPESREELVEGRRVLAVPANPPHGERHCELDYVIRGTVADDYVSATDLLTRVGPGSNFATDTCVRRRGTDPRTGARWLEELAFEVVAEQSERDITERARVLTERGVRRLVAIFVHEGEVREWSPQEGQWRVLELDETIVDPTLRRPLKVRALLDAAAADDAVVEALVDKGNPRLVALEARSRADGLRRSIALVCERLEIPTTDEQRARLSALDGPALESLLDRLLAERRWP